MISEWKQQYFFALVLISNFLKTFSYEHESFKVQTTFSETLKIETLFSWDVLKFDLKQNQQTARKIKYVEKNNILGNVRLYKDTIYVSVPRYLEGVPATLNTIKTSKRKINDASSPILHPFPSLEDNLIGDCTSLQNVLALEIDPFGRLWVVDSGNAEVFEKKSNCTAKIQIYQLCKISKIALIYALNLKQN